MDAAAWFCDIPNIYAESITPLIAEIRSRDTAILECSVAPLDVDLSRSDLDHFEIGFDMHSVSKREEDREREGGGAENFAEELTPVRPPRNPVPSSDIPTTDRPTFDYRKTTACSSTH